MSPTRNRHRLIALAAATLVAAAASPVTLAHAAPSASVSPTSVAPGGRVSLNITGCGTKTGRATSRAFGDVQLTPGNLEASNLFGGATVYANTPNGSYPVTFECGGAGGQSVTVSLNVTSGAARGGLGGSVDSMSRGQIAVGGSLVAAALGAGIWVVRRRGQHAS
ncbi:MULTISPECIES: hypothetical protein [unclassified Streptomyces]|uniref:hypothetical protein n=1 Tax=unclassified Streptomyces TaxID=2593676 RepID=UPI00224FB5C2|nr:MULTISPECIES: hypothetical protein [unclassified Streptomyces]MCX4525680.1 hypothetical protein [Streptomyces sp. NBC_01551]MCX4543844.1 hypothetical protein [Streptomyces sp. NBC_01565]